jgi:hypothetical protein
LAQREFVVQGVLRGAAAGAFPRGTSEIRRVAESGRYAVVDHARAATDLHDEMAVRTARSSAMIWRKKLSDDLSVRTEPL